MVARSRPVDAKSRRTSAVGSIIDALLCVPETTTVDLTDDYAEGRPAQNPAGGIPAYGSHLGVAGSAERAWKALSRPEQPTCGRRSLAQDALQGAPMHAQAPRRLGHIAITLLEHPLDVLPADTLAAQRRLGDGWQ